MDVYALDFDGIICDSCGESSQSAIKVSESARVLVDSAVLAFRSVTKR